MKKIEKIIEELAKEMCINCKERECASCRKNFLFLNLAEELK